ncbi:phage tail family protein [Bacillus licheniformis]|uniref:distal tail protein Dit n=1 Tax=Bacillus licheniformis TaxID=1402 RepID=UPI00227DCEBB|nr:distal tail protein Dit [Bacillus licheniformis]MCY7740873.1 phage tail family protein [Bacillus licheniformis]
MSLTFNGITKHFVHATVETQRPIWAPVERELIEIPSRPGAFFRNTKVKPRVIPVGIIIKGVADLQKAKEEVAEWLITDKPAPLILPDEPDRTYYAMIDGEGQLSEIFKFGKGTVNFVCPDPYKYGAEQSFKVNDPADPSNNQIKNGDFREGKSYWTSSNDIGEVVPVSSEQVEFKQAFEIKQPNIYLMYHLNDPNWWRGKKGFASCWAKVQNSAFDSTKGSGAALYFRARKTADQSFVYFQDDYRLTGDTDGWIQLSFSFDFTSLNEDLDQFIFAISTSGGFTVIEAQFTGFMVTLSDELTPWLPNGTTYVKSDGSAPTYPIIECTFTQAADKYEVQLLNDDLSVNAFVLLNFDFIAGDKLVLDFANRAATLNGEDKKTAYHITSDFFKIPPKKDTPISATQPSTLKFTDKYL